MSAHLNIYSMAIATERRLLVHDAERRAAAQLSAAEDRGARRPTSLAILGLGVVAGLAVSGLLAAAASAVEPSVPTCHGKAATIVADRGTLPLDQAFELRGTENDDVIVGTQGKDAIEAGIGNDVVCGLGGDDDIGGGFGDDVLYGGNGNDVIGEPYCNPSCRGDDRLYGGRGNDRLIGGDGPDLCDGGKGRDEAVGGDACNTWRHVENVL